MPCESLSSDVVTKSSVSVVVTIGEGAKAGVEVAGVVGAGVEGAGDGVALGVDENVGLKPFILRCSVLVGSKLITSKPTVRFQFYIFWSRNRRFLDKLNCDKKLSAYMKENNYFNKKFLNIILKNYYINLKQTDNTLITQQKSVNTLSCDIVQICKELIYESS